MQKEQSGTRPTAFDVLHSAKLRAPKTLTLAITGVCNLKCSHCWVDAGLASSAAHVPEAEVIRLLEEFAALGGKGVRFTGGEPLCHPHWRQFLRHARSLGFAGIGVQTNGMLLGAEAVSALREFDFPGLSLQVSLDGATASTHDRVRGAGAFAGVMDGLGRLARGGLAPRVTLFFTEMQHNLEEIPAVLEMAAELGVAAVVSGALVACGRAAADRRLAPALPSQYTRLLQRFDADPRFRELYRKLGNIAVLEWRNENAAGAECCTFVENPYLTASGLLYPCVLCHADDFAVSGVFEKGLAAALIEGVPRWSDLQRISQGRLAALPQCRDCPGRLACAGGCMGRAWGSCGDLLAADDRCEVRRTVYRLKNSERSPEG